MSVVGLLDTPTMSQGMGRGEVCGNDRRDVVVPACCDDEVVASSGEDDRPACIVSDLAVGLAALELDTLDQLVSEKSIHEGSQTLSFGRCLELDDVKRTNTLDSHGLSHGKPF